MCALCHTFNKRLAIRRLLCERSFRMSRRNPRREMKKGFSNGCRQREASGGVGVGSRGGNCTVPRFRHTPSKGAAQKRALTAPGISSALP